MKRFSGFSVALLTLAIGAWAATSNAQDTRTARGTVIAMASNSLTVRVGANDMKFSVDPQTVVVATGAGTQARKAEAAGKSGPALADVLKTGQAVKVDYRETGGMFYATRVQAVTSAGSGGGSISSQEKTSSGAVKAIAANSLTISEASGKDMTFAIDSSTNLVARGAGTKAKASGGRLALTDALKAGDRVSIDYHDMEGTMHATTVRLIAAK